MLKQADRELAPVISHEIVGCCVPEQPTAGGAFKVPVGRYSLVHIYPRPHVPQAREQRKHSVRDGAAAAPEFPSHTGM